MAAPVSFIRWLAATFSQKPARRQRGEQLLASFRAVFGLETICLEGGREYSRQGQSRFLLSFESWYLRDHGGNLGIEFVFRGAARDQPIWVPVADDQADNLQRSLVGRLLHFRRCSPRHFHS